MSRPSQHADDGLSDSIRVSLHAAGQAVGLSVAGARALRTLGNAVVHLPAAHAIARVAVNRDALPAHQLAVRVTRWLTDQGYPATRPLDVEQPVLAEGHVVTFWPYLPQHGPAPGAADLGRLVRELHAQPAPPFELPTPHPLASLHTALSREALLNADDKRWLATRCEELTDAYNRLDFRLPAGLIHGDAHLWNLLSDRDRILLGDWDHVCHGPREWDLIPIYQIVRFGVPASEQNAFAAAYGHDLTAWPGYATLKEVRDLYTLASYIRLAPTHPPVHAELEIRIRSLRHHTNERWHTQPTAPDGWAGMDDSDRLSR